MNALKISELKFMNRGPYSFEIKGGQIMCLHGQSGSGKTLLLRAIADLDPINGEIFYNDTEAKSVAANQWRHTVRYVPAESHWWFESIREHFDNHQNALDQLENFGFDNSVLDWKIHRLSTGEKQRLAIIRALNDSPQVLLLDEPTASLDTKNITRVENTILAYIKKNNIPTVWVSHDPEQIKRIANFSAEIKVGGEMRILV